MQHRPDTTLPDSESDIPQTGNPAMNAPAVDQPVNLLEVLDGMVFPASKMELIAYAQDHDASQELLTQLQAIPDDIYNTRADVVRHGSEIEIIQDRDDLWGSAESDDLPDHTDDGADDAMESLNGRHAL